MIRIGIGDGQWIGKHGCGFMEGYLVFSFIRGGLLWIPLEQHSRLPSFQMITQANLRAQQLCEDRLEPALVPNTVWREVPLLHAEPL